MHDIMISVVVRLSYSKEFPEQNFYDLSYSGISYPKSILSSQKTILNNFEIHLLAFFFVRTLKFGSILGSHYSFDRVERNKIDSNKYTALSAWYSRWMVIAHPFSVRWTNRVTYINLINYAMKLFFAFGKPLQKSFNIIHESYLNSNQIYRIDRMAMSYIEDVMDKM